MNRFKFSQRSKDRLIGVDTDLVRVSERALERYTKIDFGIPQYGGRRTEDEQQHLFITGKSKADGINDIGKHQTGDALDYYAIDPETGQASWDPALLFHIACAHYQAAQDFGVKIKSGALFRSWEYPGDAGHIEKVV
jgi:hypothetical protein